MKTPSAFPVSARLGLVLLLLAAALPRALRAQPDEGLEMFNPDWSMFINDYGYSDFAFDQRPGFQGRDSLSGEWAAAMSYVRNASSPVTPVWLNPDFIFPDWVSGSNFKVAAPGQFLATNNIYGFAILQSVITNDSLRITMRSEFIDTTNGVPQGLSPRSAPTGASRLSNRFVLRQSYAIANISGQTLNSARFFKFLHSLDAATALYHDRVYGPAYNGHHYTITQETLAESPTAGGIVHDDIVCLHANLPPGAWEVGRYGDDTIDDHIDGKPGVGVHLSVEADALSGLDWFAPTNKWVGGAVRCDLGTLAPNASTNIEFLLSLHTVTMAAPPFGIGLVPEARAWGDNLHGQTNVPAGLTNVEAVAAGGSHSVALLSGGSVVAWGDNSLGQTNIPAGLAGVQAVAAGGNHTLVLTSGGAVLGWGDNAHGQTNVPGQLTHVLAVSAGSNHSLALLDDGTVAAWGDNSAGQTNVPDLDYTYAIAAGGRHSLALLYDGTVTGWGDDAHGETDVPEAVNYYGADAIAAGANHSLALLYDGTVVGWGDDSNGQTEVPYDVNFIGALAIAAGGNHSLALLYDNTIAAWGDNANGQTNVPAALTNVTAISAGAGHNLAVNAGLVLPRMTLTRLGTNLILSFPAPASQYVATVPAIIEEQGVPASSNWVYHAAFGVIEGGNYKVTIPIAPGKKFYHLNLTP